jgi:hypothetical protein
MSEGPAFRRLAGNGWQSQRLNRLKAGLHPRRLEVLSHYAELLSGQFLRDGSHTKTATDGRLALLTYPSKSADKFHSAVCRHKTFDFMDTAREWPATLTLVGQVKAAGRSFQWIKARAAA